MSSVSDRWKAPLVEWPWWNLPSIVEVLSRGARNLVFTCFIDVLSAVHAYPFDDPLLQYCYTIHT